jgi:hypothetical protein
MKDRALYHLLMTSAQSARTLTSPEGALQIDAIVASLRIQRQSKDTYTLKWASPDGDREVSVPADHFRFYARGDVPSIVANRAPNLDDRKMNWLAAHQLWGTLLGDLTLQSLKVTPSLAMPSLGRAKSGSVFQSWLPVFVAMIASMLSRGVPNLIAASALTCVVSSLLGYRSDEKMARSVLGAMGGLICGTVAGLFVRPQLGTILAVGAGVSLLYFVSALIPSGRPDSGTSLSVVALAGVALSSAFAPAPFVFGAGILVLLDLCSIWVRGALRRSKLALGFLALVPVVATGARALMNKSVQLPTENSNNRWYLVFASVVLLATSAVAATHGVRDRFSSWLAPAILSGIGIASAAPWWTVNYSNALLVASVSASATLIVRHTFTLASPREVLSFSKSSLPTEPEPFLGPPPVAVSIGRRPTPPSLSSEQVPSEMAQPN